VTVIPGSILRLCRLRCSTTGCRDRRTALSTRHHRLSYLLYVSHVQFNKSAFLPYVHMFEAHPSDFHVLSVQLYRPYRLLAG
jgi:hypothetical protein